MIIGITGKISAGKTTVANWLKEKGAILLDLDYIAKTIYQNPDVQKYICKNWNANLITVNHEINITKLWKWILSNPENWKKLTEYTEPLVYEKLKNILKKLNSKKWIVLDAQILMNRNFNDLVDKVIYLQTKKTISIKRDKKDLNGEQFCFLWNKQKDYKDIKHKVDFLILNNHSLSVLKAKIDKMIKKENWDFVN